MWHCSDLIMNLRPESERRLCLLLHLYWTYLKRSHHTTAACESLRLVWNAVPDSFISRIEINAQLQLLGPEATGDIYDFYCKAVGECHEDVEPRPLKHHCRCAIRLQLWKCMQWLPEGIEQIGLPKVLQLYLKLENSDCFNE
ncbi:unnamed protein product [Larinioides sclopetarius]|uniref:SOCS box domain-containing protein n=1 Tax=Larinioides sclopetarius TaxID=280406 RepID=A0AAV2B426_9ARAC